MGTEPFSAAAISAVEPSASVLARFEDGTPATVLSPVGNAGGAIVQFAWQPGLSYLPNATQWFEAPDPVSDFPGAVRDILRRSLSAKDEGGVSLTTPTGMPVVGVEATLLVNDGSEHDDWGGNRRGLVVGLINWGGVPVGASLRLTMALPPKLFWSPPRAARVSSAKTGLQLQPAYDGLAMSVTAQAWAADFVVVACE